MKKILNHILKVFFIAILVLTIFQAKPSLAGDAQLVDCAVSYLPAGVSSQQQCFSIKKVTAPYYNCVSYDNPLTLNETCCCAQKIEYTCNWRTETTTSNPELSTSETTGGCYDGETIGQDCKPSDKHSSTGGFNTTKRVFCCCPKSEDNTAVADKKAPFVIPQLSVKIDTVKLSQEVFCTGEDQEGECHIPWIAEYIKGVYKYGFGIGGILAAIMLMAGGLIWLISGGDASRITKAKDLILGSIVGLMILSTSYIILTFINPELVNLKPLKIGEIEAIQVDEDSSSPVVLEKNSISQFLGINCGSDSVADIINKSKGKITYDNKKRGQKSSDNKLYLDCSSFATFVRDCAGLNPVPSFTGYIFKDKTIFNDNDTSKLTPGDLIGWPPDGGNGHVLIYLGNNIFGDVHGGTGRQPGQAVSNNITLQDIKDSAKRHNVSNLYIKR